MNQFTSGRVCLLIMAVSVAGCSDTEVADFKECTLAYELPGDISVPLATATQSEWDQFSWQSFLALNAPAVGERVAASGDNPTQWSAWSSTVDLIECNLDPSRCLCPNGDCARSGARYYPTECRDIPGFESHRVIAGIDKADDSFLEARDGGLSNSPLIDRFGNFLRYEILINPVSYDYVVQNQFYDWDVLQNRSESLSLPCGEASFESGNPADPGSGSIILKLAWMDEGLSGEQYHQEDVLVFTPAYRNATGIATCERKTLNLVGLHLVRKTLKQPSWTWATFEHERNAPDCSGLPPAGKQQPAVNTGCPASVSSAWNFAPADCSDGRCASCNQSPRSNGDCTTPDASSDPGWCLDLPPAPEAGLSYLCRQVSVAEYYPEAYAWNEGCQAALGDRSVWSRYGLIATQHVSANVGDPIECLNVQEAFGAAGSREIQRPQVPIEAQPGGAGSEVGSRPWLGNTSMESYERSNCLGCHSKARFSRSVNSDFMYWLTIETCAAWCEQNDVRPCTCLAS